MAEDAAPNHVPRLLLALLLVISSFVQLTVLSKTTVATPLGSDAGEYFSYARNLYDHGTYSRQLTWAQPGRPLIPDKMRAPGYPLVLLALGQPQPNEDWSRRMGLLQAAMTVGIVLLSYLIARRMAGWKAGLACGVLVATNPFVSIMAVYVLSETTFTLAMLAAVALSLRAMDDEAPAAWAVAAGVCWGLCSLVRPTTEFFVPLLLIGCMLVPAWRRWRRPAAIAVACFALTMAPWWVRNLGVPEAPGTSVMVNSIVHGSYPGFMYEDDPRTREVPYRFDPGARASGRDMGAALGHVARLFAKQPWRYAMWYLLGKPYFFLSLEDVQSQDIQIYRLTRTPWYDQAGFEIAAAASRALHWPVTILALGFALLLARRAVRDRLSPQQRHGAIVVALLLGYAIALHMVAAPFPRYAIPFRPLMYALALLALVTGWRQLRNPS